jgi:hypothetical protein
VNMALPMSDLIKLALVLTEGAAVRHGRQAIARVACVAAVTIAAASCAIAAVACVLTALWIYVLPHVGATGAPLVVAGVLLAMCLVTLVLMRNALKPRRTLSPASVTPKLLLAEATRLLKEHEGPVLMTALLAGLIAGGSEK